MSTIYSVLFFLAELPVILNIRANIWLIPLATCAPLLIFFVPVERTATSHVVKVAAAIGLTYVLINVSLHAGHALDWIAYQDCQDSSPHPDMSPEMEDECGHHINTADGAQNAFALLFGWIPSAAYVGLWEGLWRIRHRRKIKEIGEKYRLKWFSNLVVGLAALPVFAYFLLWAVF